MENWLRDSLSKCLECVVTEQMMSAILAIKTDQDFDNYFGNLLSEENEEHRLFLLNCRRMLLSGKQPRQRSTKSNQNHSPPAPAGKSGSGKSGKYTNIYASETKVLKGRRQCQCQATQHKLINNCLGCGRIVCEQEGSGPCLFCNELVYTAAEEDQLLAKAHSGQTTKGNKKKQQQQSQSQSLDQALAQRDRLLEYDKNSEKRTTVIDDELDYFQENSVWLTEEEREKFERLKSEMQELKHGSRLKRKIKIDFAGREVQDEQPEQRIMQELQASINSSKGNFTSGLSMAAPNLDMAKPLVYRANKDFKTSMATISNDGLERVYNRVQDKELMEMQDMRQCLSMHQPWASLLIAGIKKHEGRVWYSEHRGRLWIASTSKLPHDEDIEHMEQFYKQLYQDPNLKFPEHYPTASLLGCVHVDDCLPQETYRDLYPHGESDSPYVLVCTKPEQLPIFLPVQGDHKIYELPLKTHNAACKTLLKARALAAKATN
ncbi:uncharacterized protein Dwil_GK25493 [Drosophila willistoni]|uniref:ASCH domain-containing protein n=1 Tax=Drosophila willistoni TaxID=7260 RepID=B4NDQ4_DROWI|nr:activating signal cointegrator 1 [Drosophila willistoni]EDW81876.1 uncharacterized protein Dwil_GK25493 [Drosophila willistoni]